MNKPLIAVALILIPALSGVEAQAQRNRTQKPTRIQPTHANVRYGKHARNVLDLYLAKSEKPTPFVVYIHGGGFRAGDKRSIDRRMLKKLAANGISMAAFHYRLTQTAPYPAPMLDCARALQFLRHHAKKYNLDPKRVGATGGSAGSGISQWLACRDDLADKESKDPIARQSTRLAAVVPINAQCSYDPRFIQELFDTDKIHPALVPFFGMKDRSDIADKRFHPLFEAASPITHATKDDPPMLFFFPQKNTKLRKNSSGAAHIHHPKFGIVMKKKLDALGVECRILFREDHPKGVPVDEIVAFFVAKLSRVRGKR